MHVSPHEWFSFIPTIVLSCAGVYTFVSSWDSRKCPTKLSMCLNKHMELESCRWLPSGQDLSLIHYWGGRNPPHLLSTQWDYLPDWPCTQLLISGPTPTLRLAGSHVPNSSLTRWKHWLSSFQVLPINCPIDSIFPQLRQTLACPNLASYNCKVTNSSNMKV